MVSERGVTCSVLSVTNMFIKSVSDAPFRLTNIDAGILSAQLTDNFVDYIFCVATASQSRFTCVTPLGAGWAGWTFEG